MPKFGFLSTHNQMNYTYHAHDPFEKVYHLINRIKEDVTQYGYQYEIEWPRYILVITYIDCKEKIEYG